MKLWLTAVVSVIALALPASAGAALCAPPGASGVVQYLEVVPGPGCSHPASGPGSGPSGGGHHSLSSSTSRKLASQGAAGKAVQQLVASSGTTTAASSHAGGGRKRSSVSAASASRPVPSAPGRGPVSALLHAVGTGSGSGGLGALMPAFLAGVVVALGATALLRRRRVSQ